MLARQGLRAVGGTGRQPGSVSSALRPPLSSVGPPFPKLGPVSESTLLPPYSVPSAASPESQAEDGNVCVFPAWFCALSGCTRQTDWCWDSKTPKERGDSVVSIPEPSLRGVMSL